jgi:hypothetical protein
MFANCLKQIIDQDMDQRYEDVVWKIELCAPRWGWDSEHLAMATALQKYDNIFYHEHLFTSIDEIKKDDYDLVVLVHGGATACKRYSQSHKGRLFKLEQLSQSAMEGKATFTNPARPSGWLKIEEKAYNKLKAEVERGARAFALGVLMCTPKK